MSDLKKLMQQVVAFRNKRKWDPNQNPKNLMLGLFIEAGELAEYFHYPEGQELRDFLKDHKTEVSEELSDVLYWVLLMANDLDIDLEEAFQHKMKKNALKYPEPKQGETIGKAMVDEWKRQIAKNAGKKK